MVFQALDIIGFAPRDIAYDQEPGLRKMAGNDCGGL
jgi:hypothetical protein